MAEYHIRLRVNARNLNDALAKRHIAEVITVYEEHHQDFPREEK